MYGKWLRRVDASLSQSRAGVRACVGNRARAPVIGAMAVVLLLGSAAWAEFLVKPIIMPREVMPGTRVPLDFEIENLGADATEQVGLKIIDVTKDPNGLWMEVCPDSLNTRVGALARPSCKDWLTCPVASVQVTPHQVIPVRIMADIPPDARGSYAAALFAEALLHKTPVDDTHQGVKVRLEYLVPIVLEVQTPPSDWRPAPAAPPAAQGAATPPPPELSGRVLDPNGRPVAGAQVVLAAQGCWAMLRNAILEKGALEDERKGEFVATDSEGRFHFKGQWADPFYLLAAHTSGFVAVTGRDFLTSRDLRLQRWGRIEGQLAPGCGGPDQRVWMVGLVSPAWAGRQCHLQYDTPHTADGRFVFERVPAGWFNVGHLLAIGEHSQGFTMRTPVAVKAGETARVQVGGEGRPVVGRFVPPASYSRALDFGAGLRALRRDEKIERDREKMRRRFEQQAQDDPYALDMYVDDPRTANYVVVDANDQRQLRRFWYEMRDDAFLASDGIWSDMDWRGYAFRIRPDGSFRIAGVIPGRYELRVELEESNIEDKVPWPYAKYRGIIEVPSRTEPHTDEPFDIGSLTLDIVGVVGGRAPSFQARALDGQLVRLSDYRGIFVLVSFSGREDPRLQSYLQEWHRAHGAPDDLHSADRGLLSSLQELHRTYGARGDLQIIERYYASPNRAQRYVAAHQVPWPVIAGAGDFPDAAAGQFHVHRYPNAVLVDPEGNIVASNLEKESLTKTVRDALAGAAAPTTAPTESHP